MNRAELIRRGNIITTMYTTDNTVGRYLGNGRFGAIMESVPTVVEIGEEAARPRSI